MTQIKDFKEFDIKPTQKILKGDKMKMERLLNREIIVHDFLLFDSTQVAGTKYMHLQIEISEIKYVVFTGSKGLMEAIEKIPKDGYPFKTTIVRDNDWLRFT